MSIVTVATFYPKDNLTKEFLLNHLWIRVHNTSIKSDVVQVESGPGPGAEIQMIMSAVKAWGIEEIRNKEGYLELESGNDNVGRYIRWHKPTWWKDELNELPSRR
jgi:hypothetical protein